MSASVKLTKPQQLALAYLASVDWSTPADLGYAMAGDIEHPMRAQGAGRVGGCMGTRLSKMGLAGRHYREWPGKGRYAAGYEITQSGRAALRDTP